jgi:integrase/recombinase XerC
VESVGALGQGAQVGIRCLDAGVGGAGFQGVPDEVTEAAEGGAELDELGDPAAGAPADQACEEGLAALGGGLEDLAELLLPVNRLWRPDTPGRPLIRRSWGEQRDSGSGIGGSMALRVCATEEGPRLADEADGAGAAAVNRFLGHLAARAFSPATVRAYAFDLLNFLRFCAERGLGLASVRPADVFAYLDWQARTAGRAGGTVVRLAERRGAAPATMNRRIAAVRGLFEYLVMAGDIAASPVPAARRSSGLRASRRGLLGHLGPGRPRSGGRLVRAERRLPESLEPADVEAFLADLATHRDRAIVLAMLLGGLRAAEVRGLLLANVDMGLRRLRLTGKGGRERVVPADAAFFAELAAYLREERPKGCRTAQCFVVLRGPTAGQPLTEAGLRSLFRTHREHSGAIRVRPHRLRHTYGSELASAGVDLLVLRELMGHVSPETTAGYVHLSPETLAAQYAAARGVSGR